MQAIQVEEFGSPEVLKLKTTDVPQVGENQVCIWHKSFTSHVSTLGIDDVVNPSVQAFACNSYVTVI